MFYSLRVSLVIRNHEAQGQSTCLILVLLSTTSASMNWHYAINGEQQGPISENELKQLFESGQLKENDLIWREGLSEWVSYDFVFVSPTSEAARQASAPVSHGAQGPALDAPVLEGFGTGGRTPNADLRKQALEALKGQWGVAIGLVIVSYLAFIVMGFIPILGLLATVICSGPLIMGIVEFFVRVYRRAGPEFGQLFNGFKNFPLGLALYLLLFVISVGATLIAIIPGGILIGIAVASSQGGSEAFTPLMGLGFGLLYIMMFGMSIMLYLYFGLSFFIALDEPELGAVHALKKSPAMIKGHKGKLFMMYLVFFGWSLLTVFTLFIGMLWVGPYCITSLVAFYDDLKDPAAA